MIRTTYTAVVKSNFDAGIYREFFESNYGQVLAFGYTSGATLSRAYRHAKTLARLAGLTVTEVIESAKDAAILDDES